MDVGNTLLGGGQAGRHCAGRTPVSKSLMGQRTHGCEMVLHGNGTRRSCLLIAFVKGKGWPSGAGSAWVRELTLDPVFVQSIAKNSDRLHWEAGG